MPAYNYERLSAQDATFLWAESENEPMHVGAIAVFESGPLRREHGGIDIARFRRGIEAVLHWIPRYRQRLAWTPIENWPVWIDDRGFDIGYHIRHIALPKPGSIEQLKELAARIHARPLDRRHPLWEIWVIEGLEEGAQFAMLNKIHHCMIDGAAGADLSQILLSPSPRAEPGDPLPYIPRRAPSELELLRDSVRRILPAPLEWARTRLFAAWDDPGEDDPAPAWDAPGAPTAAMRIRSLAEMLRFALEPASETPINGPLGKHRSVEWLAMPLEDVRELREALDCTINDIVLTTVCGALRRYLFRRRIDTRELDFRIAAPVSTRKEEHDRRQGNHVSTWIIPLPLATESPLAQLEAIRTTTLERKHNGSALAIETLMEWLEWLPAPVIAASTGFANGPANMIVTNVRGPSFPLHALGARLLAMYPLVPLLPGGGLGTALFSYDEMLCWGFHADAERVPDLEAFADDVRVAFEELRAAAVAEYMASRTDRSQSGAGDATRRVVRSPRTKAASRAGGPVRDVAAVTRSESEQGTSGRPRRKSPRKRPAAGGAEVRAESKRASAQRAADGAAPVADP